MFRQRVFKIKAFDITFFIYVLLPLKYHEETYELSWINKTYVKI